MNVGFLTYNMCTYILIFNMYNTNSGTDKVLLKLLDELRSTRVQTFTFLSSECVRGSTEKLSNANIGEFSDLFVNDDTSLKVRVALKNSI